MQVYDLLRESTSVGVKPTVVLPDKGALGYMLGEIGVPVLPPVAFRNWLDNRTAFQWYRKWLLNRSLAYDLAETEVVQAQDVIHSHSITRPFGAMLAEAAKKPHVWHFHERAMAHRERPFRRSTRWVRNWIERRTDCAIVPSESLREWAGKYIDDSLIEVVPNGLVGVPGTYPKNRRLSRKLKPVQIAVVGRLGEKKGTFDAIMALGILIGQGVDAQLRFAGEVDEKSKNAIHRAASTATLGNRISFSGYVPDMTAELASCDVVLMPSHYESFGRVTVEAMAAGKPVVATSSGGTVDIVEDGVTGVLRAPEMPEELADGILWLLDHPTEADEIRKRAWNQAHERYSRNLYAERIRAIYDEVVDSKSAV